MIKPIQSFKFEFLTQQQLLVYCDRLNQRPAGNFH